MTILIFSNWWQLSRRTGPPIAPQWMTDPASLTVVRKSNCTLKLKKIRYGSMLLSFMICVGLKDLKSQASAPRVGATMNISWLYWPMQSSWTFLFVSKIWRKYVRNRYKVGSRFRTLWDGRGAFSSKTWRQAWMEWLLLSWFFACLSIQETAVKLSAA